MSFVTRWKILVTLLAGVLLAAPVVGCGGDGDGDGDSDGDTDGDSDGDSDGDTDGDTDGDSDGDTDGDGDSDCTEGCSTGPWSMTTISGRVRDNDGAPWSGSLLAAVCIITSSVNRCLNSPVDESGNFSVDASALPNALEVSVSFISGELAPFVPFCKIEELCDGPIQLCGPFRLLAAPTSGSPIPMEAELAADVRVEAADTGALVFRAGSEVVPPISHIGNDWLALTRWDLATNVPCFIDEAAPPLALYAVTPVDVDVLDASTAARVPAELDLPNETGLAAGTEVDVYQLGGKNSSTVDATFHEGDWRPAVTATVSADGTRIQTAAGVGLDYLTWFAIYER